MPRVAVISLGCAKNQVDSEVMLGCLGTAGYVLTDDPQAADCVVLNTCGFIEAARKEALQAILEVVARRRQGYPRVVVSGCLVPGHLEELARELPEVEALVGPGLAGHMDRVVARVLAGERVLAAGTRGAWEDQPLPRLVTGAGYSAYLKIAEGCDHRCSFCSIPRLRGPYRSRPRETILAEAASLVAQGTREIVLLAQDTSSYGRERYGRSVLADLLREGCRLEGLAWLRLLYLYPTGVSEELLEVMAGEPKICPYFDLPLQHIAPGVLRRMGRPPTARTRRLLARIRALLPEAALRSTFIVGFPGETEEDFAELLDFLEEAQLDWVGALAYSAEEDTPAARLPGQVPREVKQERRRRLLERQARITAQRHRRWLGRQLPVLVEGVGPGSGVVRGRTPWQAPEVDGVVYVRGAGVRPGAIIPVEITQVRGYDLWGRPAPS